MSKATTTNPTYEVVKSKEFDIIPRNKYQWDDMREGEVRAFKRLSAIDIQRITRAAYTHGARHGMKFATKVLPRKGNQKLDTLVVKLVSRQEEAASAE